MADVLVERLTGQSDADAVPLEVHVVISQEALVGGGPAAAEVDGYGPVPPALVRRWVSGKPADDGVGSPAPEWCPRHQSG